MNKFTIDTIPAIILQSLAIVLRTLIFAILIFVYKQLIVRINKKKL